MWWSVSSNRSTAQWRPRIFFSSCSLQVQWSRYLFTFCFGVSVSVLIFAMIQDQALVASKKRKHYLIETKENSPGHKQVVGSFKILKNSYFKISKVSFAESFHAALRSIFLFTYYHCMVDELKLDLKMFRLSGMRLVWPLSKNILNLVFTRRPFRDNH